MLTQFKTLYDLFEAFPDEQSAINHLTAIRWANGEFCAVNGCVDAKVFHFSDGKTHKCSVCRARFSIKVGTIFQDTKIPLRKWFAAVWMITAHPKGIASTTLATDLGVTQKTAWFMLHRLRHAARTDSFNGPLDGHVEVDETFVGGKAKNMHKGKRPGQGTSGKVAVIGAISRQNGSIVAKVINDTTTATLDGFVHASVSPQADAVSTDEHAGYRNLGRAYNHQIVRHTAGEYVRGETHTNSIEGAWALLKRQIIGVHHWVSPKHLDRYVGEMTYRWNRRDLNKADLVNDLLAHVEGRLTYKVLIA